MASPLPNLVCQDFQAGTFASHPLGWCAFSKRFIEKYSFSAKYELRKMLIKRINVACHKTMLQRWCHFFCQVFLSSGVGIKGIQHRREKDAKLTIGAQLYGIKYILSLLSKFEY